MSDLPIWREIYSSAFPCFKAMVDHRDDGEHQRAGIDRSIVLSNSKQILIDEKARGRNKKTGRIYEDIALEYWSDEQRKKPGWICKPLRADFIAYAIVPLGKCYLLPVPQLQAAWLENEKKWRALPRIVAENFGGGRRWNTVSVGISVTELFSAIGRALRVNFTAIPDFVDGSTCVSANANRIAAPNPSQPAISFDDWLLEYETSERLRHA